MVIAPSDHLILDENEFANCVKKSLKASENNDILITLGIKPSRPDTGYGYIQFTNNYLPNEKKFKRVKPLLKSLH